VDEPNYAKNQEDDSENDDKALHSPELITSTVIRVRNASRRTPAPDLAQRCPDWFTET
jgi:hypothetical protein